MKECAALTRTTTLYAPVRPKRLDTRDQLREAVEIIHLQEANSGVSNS